MTSAADPAGHYSRPDVTRLLLNARPSPRVEALGPRFEVGGGGAAEQPKDAAAA